MCLCMLSAGWHAVAQGDTIWFSTAQVEELFLKQNLQLIAEKLNIDKADAAIVQAKLWPNPTLTIDQVNLWSTDAQRQGVDEVIPPFAGSFGKNLEFGIGIDQVILMGGKRGKLVAMEKVAKDIAVQYYEELLCSLKAELRTTCAELAYAQQYFGVLEQQQAELSVLIANYREQVRQGNVSQTQLLRLQAALLEVQSEQNDTRKEIHGSLKDLRTLLNLSTPIYIGLTAEDRQLEAPESLSFGRLADLATFRPDLKRAVLQTDYYSRSLRYERAQRVPDITLHAAYDRGGNCMLDFVGFGVSIDLPFFNRNQGAIKAARISHRQSQFESEHKQTAVHNEVAEAFENYRMAYDFNRRISSEFISSLDDICASYTRNFVNRNISILEYLDFFEIYKDNKRTQLAAQKDVRILFEELQYAVGSDLVMTHN